MKPLCIISGGTSGIGFAIAQSLRAEYSLALIYQRDHQRAQVAVESLSGSESEPVRAFSANLADPAEALSVCQEIEVWHPGAASVLINCAGRANTSFFVTDSLESVANTVEDNLYTCLNLTHAVLRRMFSARAGRVINFSSISVEIMSPANVSYAMAKAAVEAFTKGVAQEVYRRGIRVNCIRPGLVLTPMTINTLKAHPEKTKLLVPLSAVVGAVHYLLSEEANAVSGSVLTVDHDTVLTR